MRCSYDAGDGDCWRFGEMAVCQCLCVTRSQPFQFYKKIRDHLKICDMYQALRICWDIQETLLLTLSNLSIWSYLTWKTSYSKLCYDVLWCFAMFWKQQQCQLSSRYRIPGPTQFDMVNCGSFQGQAVTSVVRFFAVFTVSTCFTINMAINMEWQNCKQNQTQNHKMPQFGCLKESDVWSLGWRTSLWLCN